MILIGISGKKRSGKNTLAKCIEVLAAARCIEFSFADALKKEVCTACRIDRKYLEEHKENFRLILQGWGTDFKRKLVSDTYWTEKLGKQLLDAPSDCIAIVTDVRFKNEADFLRECGGVVVRVNRESSFVDDAHSSEVELDGYRFDFVIDNNSTLNSLAEDVKQLLHNLKIKMKK